MKCRFICVLCSGLALFSCMGSATEAKDLEGVWDVSTTQGDLAVKTKMYMRVINGKLHASVLAQVESGANQMAGASAVAIEGDVLSWEIPVPYVTEDGASVTVTVTEGSFEGAITSSLGETPITGVLTELPLPAQVDPTDVAYLIGNWDVKALIGESESEGWVIIELNGGSLFGTLSSAIGTFTSDNVEYNKTGATSCTVLLNVTIPGTVQTMQFKLDIDGNSFEGEELNSNGMFKVSGTKAEQVSSETTDDTEAGEGEDTAAAHEERVEINSDATTQNAETSAIIAYTTNSPTIMR